MNEMNDKIIFTRYLYIKEEVELALIFSIINKDEERSLFWSFELYMSGFKKSFTNLIIMIYNDFYSLINERLGKKLIEYTNALMKYNDLNMIIIIIENLIVNKIDYAVFYIRNLGDVLYKNVSEISIIEIDSIIKNVIMEMNIINIERFLICVINNDISLEEIKALLSSLLSKKEKKIKKISGRLELIIFVLREFVNKYHKSLKSCMIIENKRFTGEYIIDDMNSINYSKYMNIEEKEIKPYNILKNKCIYGTNDHDEMSLFNLQRYKTNIKEIYWYKWLYYCINCRLWFDRINLYKIFINDEKEEICFEDDESLELFYDKYGYEPDEQSKKIQDKSIGEIKNNTSWYDFYNNHITTILQIDKDLLIDVDRINLGGNIFP